MLHPFAKLTQGSLRPHAALGSLLVRVVQLFNSHTLHHLFPTVDETRLHALHPVLRQTCAEFGVPYKVYTWSDLAYTTLLTWVIGRKRASMLQSKAKQP